MTLATWKNILLMWVKSSYFMWKNPNELEESDLDGFLIFCIQLVDISLRTRDLWLNEFYPEFKVNLDANGHIRLDDYVYVYTLLLHYISVIQPREYFLSGFQNLPSHIRKPIMRFISLTKNGIKVTRSEIYDLIFNMLNVENESLANLRRTAVENCEYVPKYKDKTPMLCNASTNVDLLDLEAQNDTSTSTLDVDDSNILSFSLIEQQEYSGNVEENALIAECNLSIVASGSVGGNVRFYSYFFRLKPRLEILPNSQLFKKIVKKRMTCLSGRHKNCQLVSPYPANFLSDDPTNLRSLKPDISKWKLYTFNRETPLPIIKECKPVGEKSKSSGEEYSQYASSPDEKNVDNVNPQSSDKQDAQSSVGKDSLSSVKKDLSSDAKDSHPSYMDNLQSSDKNDSQSSKKKDPQSSDKDFQSSNDKDSLSINKEHFPDIQHSQSPDKVVHQLYDKEVPQSSQEKDLHSSDKKDSQFFKNDQLSIIKQTQSHKDNNQTSGKGDSQSSEMDDFQSSKKKDSQSSYKDYPLLSNKTDVQSSGIKNLLLFDIKDPQYSQQKKSQSSNKIDSQSYENDQFSNIKYTQTTSDKTGCQSSGKEARTASHNKVHQSLDKTEPEPSDMNDLQSTKKEDLQVSDMACPWSSDNNDFQSSGIKDPQFSHDKDSKSFNEDFQSSGEQDPQFKEMKHPQSFHEEVVQSSHKEVSQTSHYEVPQSSHKKVQQSSDIGNYQFSDKRIFQPTNMDDSIYENLSPQDKIQMIEIELSKLVIRLCNIMEKYKTMIKNMGLLDLTSHLLLDYIENKLEMLVGRYKSDCQLMAECMTRKWEPGESGSKQDQTASPENNLMYQLQSIKTLVTKTMEQLHLHAQRQVNKLIKQYDKGDNIIGVSDPIRIQEKLNSVMIEFASECDQLQQTIQNLIDSLKQKCNKCDSLKDRTLEGVFSEEFSELAEPLDACQKELFTTQRKLKNSAVDMRAHKSQQYINQLKQQLFQKTDECMRLKVNNMEQQLEASHAIDQATDRMNYMQQKLKVFEKNLNKSQYDLYDVKQQLIQKTFESKMLESSEELTPLKLEPEPMEQQLSAKNLTIYHELDVLTEMELKKKLMDSQQELKISQQKLYVIKQDLMHKTDECHMLEMLTTLKNNSPQNVPPPAESKKLQYCMHQENRAQSQYNIEPIESNLEMQKQLEISKMEQIKMQQEILKVKELLSQRTDECERLKMCRTSEQDLKLITDLKKELEKREESSVNIRQILAGSQYVNKQYEKIILEAQEKLNHSFERGNGFLELTTNSSEENMQQELEVSQQYLELVKQQEDELDTYANK